MLFHWSNIVLPGSLNEFSNVSIFDRRPLVVPKTIKENQLCYTIIDFSQTNFLRPLIYSVNFRLLPFYGDFVTSRVKQESNKKSNTSRQPEACLARRLRFRDDQLNNSFYFCAI